MVQYALLAFHAFRSSPVHDEFGHFYAGTQYWIHGDTEVFNVNPPLVRALGTVTSLREWPELWSFKPAPTNSLEESPSIFVNPRYEFAAGRVLFSLYPAQFRQSIFQGRLICSLFAVSATVVLFIWGRQLFGTLAGLSAATLWAFQPEILSHGSLITNDVPVASMMLSACYVFSHWLTKFRWRLAFLGGLALGIATLCKFTALLLWPIFLIYALLAWRRTGDSKTPLQTILAIAVALTVIGMPYGYRGMGTPLGQISFYTDAILDQPREEIPPRYADEWFAKFPIPVPLDFVRGMDRQQVDFDQGIISYAAGTSAKHGWWWFYLYSMLVKLPTGTWVAILAWMALVAFRLIDRSTSILPRRDVALVAVVALAMVEITAYKSGFSQQHRYIFPLYPFLFLLVVAPLRDFSFRSGGATRRWRIELPRQKPVAVAGSLILVGLMGTVIAATAIAPHWLGAFNWFSGGTANGFHHLRGDASDWRQDNDLVVQWIKDHPNHRPLDLVSHPFDGFLNNPFGIPPEVRVTTNPISTWTIISVDDLAVNNGIEDYVDREPVTRIGATHFVYRNEP